MICTGVYSLKLYEITEFKGLNESPGGEMSLQKGESLNMDNFRISDGKLITRDGFRKISALGSFTSLQGIAYGKVSYFDPLLYFVADNTLYSYSFETAALTTLASIENMYDSSEVCMFFWADILYIVTSSQYYKYYTSGLSIVEGYTPTLKTGVLPNGSGGTAVEERNLLTKKAIMEFTGDGASTAYKVHTGTITVSYVSVNSVQTTAFTVNSTSGTVTFTTAPVSGAKVVIEYSMTGFAKRNLVTGCVSGLAFGGTNDTVLFLWGNVLYPYLRVNSGAGNPEFFPESNCTYIGTRQYAITDIVWHYNRQIIFTEKDIYYSVISESGSKTTYPVYPLNSSVGNKVKGCVQIIDNNPVFIDNGVYSLTSTSVRDERNVKNIGGRVNSVKSLDLEKAVTFDNEENGEYYLSIGSVTYVYNYREDAWYKFSGFAPKRYLNVENVLYFIDSENNLCRFEKNLENDYRTNGGTAKTPITAYWEMPFYDFGTKISYKFTDRIYLSLLPKNKNKLTVSFENDNGESLGKTVIENRAFGFSATDFQAFSFATVLRTKPYVLRIKSRGYTCIRLKLESSAMDGKCTILSVAIPANIAGKIR